MSQTGDYSIFTIRAKIAGRPGAAIRHVYVLCRPPSAASSAESISIITNGTDVRVSVTTSMNPRENYSYAVRRRRWPAVQICASLFYYMRRSSRMNYLNTSDVMFTTTTPSSSTPRPSTPHPTLLVSCETSDIEVFRGRGD